jgi:hypothetical protein
MKKNTLIRTLLLFCITSILSINSFGQTANQKSNITLVSSWNAGYSMIYEKKWLYCFTFSNTKPDLNINEEFVNFFNESKDSDLLPKFDNDNNYVALMMDQPEQLESNITRCFVWIYDIKKQANFNQKKLKNKGMLLTHLMGKNSFVIDEKYQTFLELEENKNLSNFDFDKTEEIDLLNTEKKKYDEEQIVINYENQTILEFLKDNFIKVQLSDSLSKKGVEIPSLLDEIGFKFQGVITPEIEGVLQVYNSKDRFDYGNLKLEYVISNSKMVSLKIYQFRAPSISKSYGDIVINFNDTLVIKTLDYNTFKSDFSIYDAIKSNTLIFNEFKVLNSDALSSLFLKLKNLKSHTRLQINDESCENWFYKFVKPISKRISSDRYTANIIKKNISNVINDENIDDVLKRKTWITYTNNANKVLPYNYSNITVTDSSFIIERIGDIENKKYMERYILDRMSFSKYTYNGGIFESGYSEHIILAQKNKSSYRMEPSFCIHNPLITKWNRTGQDNIQLNVFIDGKKLLEGNVDNNGNLKGWCNYYSVNAKVYQNRYYDTLKPKTINGVLFSSSQLKPLTTFKYCLSAMDVSSSYNKQGYNAQFDLKYWDPMPFESIYLNIFPDFSPLSITPLGKFNTSLKLFVDKTDDYLSQRAFFSTVGTSEYKGEKYGTLKVLYQYLPDGQIYDSVNTNKNEFGEQLGKSSLKPFPLGQEYIVLMKKEQNDIEELKIKSMQGMLKELNTCDHCGTEILAGKKITTHEFKCANGKNYILDDLFGRKFCSPKCYSEYQKAWCDMQ